MNKIIFLFCIVASMLLIDTGTVFAQTPDLPATLQIIAAEKDEDKKFTIIANTLYGWLGYDSDVSQMITFGQAMMQQGKDKKDRMLEAAGYCELGFGFRMAGNSIKGLEYHQKALEQPEK